MMRPVSFNECGYFIVAQRTFFQPKSHQPDGAKLPGSHQSIKTSAKLPVLRSLLERLALDAAEVVIQRAIKVDKAAVTTLASFPKTNVLLQLTQSSYQS